MPTQWVTVTSTIGDFSPSVAIGTQITTNVLVLIRCQTLSANQNPFWLPLERIWIWNWFHPLPLSLGHPWTQQSPCTLTSSTPTGRRDNYYLCLPGAMGGISAWKVDWFCTFLNLIERLFVHVNQWQNGTIMSTYVSGPGHNLACIVSYCIRSIY